MKSNRPKVYCKIPGENFGKEIGFKAVNLSTIEGIEKAEKLVNAGWKTGSVGLVWTSYFRYKG